MGREIEFGLLRSMAHAEQPDVVGLAWAVLERAPSDQRDTWRDYVLGVLEGSLVGDVLAFVWAGEATFREKLASVQEPVPVEHRLTDEDASVFLCALAWSLSNHALKNTVMFARTGMFVYWEPGPGTLTYALPNASYAPGLMGDTMKWPGIPADLDPPAAFAAKARRGGWR